MVRAFADRRAAAEAALRLIEADDDKDSDLNGASA